MPEAVRFRAFFYGLYVPLTEEVLFQAHRRIHVSTRLHSKVASLPQGKVTSGDEDSSAGSTSFIYLNKTCLH